MKAWLPVENEEVRAAQRQHRAALTHECAAIETFIAFNFAPKSRAVVNPGGKVAFEPLSAHKSKGWVHRPGGQLCPVAKPALALQAESASINAGVSLQPLQDQEARQQWRRVDTMWASAADPNLVLTYDPLFGQLRLTARLPAANAHQVFIHEPPC